MIARSASRSATEVAVLRRVEELLDEKHLAVGVPGRLELACIPAAGAVLSCPASRAVG
jgi:hypothetical protein